MQSYDLLPEHTPYRDEGCDLFPACLRCPLPACRYDEPGRLQRDARRRRDQEVLRLVREGGRSPDELAIAFGMSVRTVYRILRRPGRPAPADGPTNRTDRTDPMRRTAEDDGRNRRQEHDRA